MANGIPIQRYRTDFTSLNSEKTENSKRDVKFAFRSGDAHVSFSGTHAESHCCDVFGKSAKDQENLRAKGVQKYIFCCLQGSI